MMLPMFSPLFILLHVVSASPLPDSPSIEAFAKDLWPGWSSIKYIFTFGDSYTTTGFSVDGQQPAPGDPLGNPVYPGYTSANGPNWIDYLASVYNKSSIEVVNLAYGGATVDANLVRPYEDTVLSLKDQVDILYLPSYSKPTLAFSWKPEDTLFGFWIGINDVGNSYYTQNATLNGDIFAVYSDLVEQIYQTGARNFLFINVPPVNRAPLTTAEGEWAIETEAADIAEFNSRITAMAANLTETHGDTKTFVFDSNALFDKVLGNPCSYYQTCPIKNTTSYCAAYENGTLSWDTYIESCGVPVDEYFWLNTLHPTTRVHNVTAQQIAEQLEDSVAC